MTTRSADAPQPEPAHEQTPKEAAPERGAPDAPYDPGLHLPGTLSCPVVRTQQLEIVNAQGEAQAVLMGGGGGGATLAMLDRAGHQRLRLMVCEDGTASVTLHGEDGKERAALILQPDGNVGLSFLDEQRPRIYMGWYQKLDAALLTVNDKDGNPVWGR